MTMYPGRSHCSFFLSLFWCPFLSLGFYLDCIFLDADLGGTVMVRSMNGMLSLVECLCNRGVSWITLGAVGLLEVGVVVGGWSFTLLGSSAFSLNSLESCFNELR